MQKNGTITSWPGQDDRLPPEAGVTFEFAEDVDVSFEERTAYLERPNERYAIRNVSDRLRSILLSARGGPVDFHAAEMSRFERRALVYIAHDLGHLFRIELWLKNERVLCIDAVTSGKSYVPARVSKDSRVRLSRFALARVCSDSFTLESPLVRHRASLAGSWVATLLTALAVDTSATEMADMLTHSTYDPGVSDRELVWVLEHLVGIGLVEIGNEGTGPTTFYSYDDETLRHWEFHDLLFHSRSRIGRWDQPAGAVFPFLGDIPAQPALKEVPSGPVTLLAKPVEGSLSSPDANFFEVLEGRRSTREHGRSALTVQDIGHYLYRVARVRSQRAANRHTPYDVATRPYPGGGAVYELELYLSINRCAGLAPAIYYYAPADHKLVLLSSDEQSRHEMSARASRSVGVESSPDVLLTICSRFQRLSWKYRGIAYATTLRNVGVLYQTLYLVAAAMGIGACGIGNGDSDLAAQVLGLDYLRESSVGDFMIGAGESG